MNLKTLLLSMTVMASAPAFAATYYVTPEGAGSKNGSNWDNAFGVAEFRAQAEANTNGDIYNFAGGLYNLSDGTVVFKTATGATLKGNADGERTVFSGDKDGNNNPDNGDANRLIRFQANTKAGDMTNAVIVEDIDFTGVYTWTDNDDTNTGAFVVDNCGYTLVKGCRFYSNWAQGSRGGAAATIFRSMVKFENCMFYNNTANYRGGAIRIYSKDAGKGDVTLENCIVKNNKNYHDLGGAIFMGHGNSLNIVNTTIAGNSAETGRGAAIYFNGYDANQKRVVSIVNSTIAGNTCGVEDDAQIVTTTSAHLNVANSIITSTDEVAAVKFTGDALAESFQFVSGGYNVAGNIIAPEDTELDWKDTDHHGSEYTYKYMFAENILNGNNVLEPATFELGATGAEVTEAVADWGMPSDLDLAVDQLGNARTGEVTPGAYAITAPMTTSINSAITSDEAELVHIAGDIYAVNGYQGPVTVYNISGGVVLGASSSNIDLGRLGAGLYILNCGNKNFKIAK